MNQTWDKGAPPDTVAIGPLGWALALARGLVLAVLVFGCLGLLLLVRLVERPISWEDKVWLTWPHDAGVVLTR